MGRDNISDDFFIVIEATLAGQLQRYSLPGAWLGLTSLLVNTTMLEINMYTMSIIIKLPIYNIKQNKILGWRRQNNVFEVKNLSDINFHSPLTHKIGGN